MTRCLPTKRRRMMEKMLFVTPINVINRVNKCICSLYKILFDSTEGVVHDMVHKRAVMVA